MGPSGARTLVRSTSSRAALTVVVAEGVAATLLVLSTISTPASKSRATVLDALTGRDLLEDLGLELVREQGVRWGFRLEYIGDAPIVVLGGSGGRDNAAHSSVKGIRRAA